MYGLTPREEQIMNTIWNMDHPCLISEVLKAEPSLKRNTVAPALVVLENKGFDRKILYQNRKSVCGCYFKRSLQRTEGIFRCHFS